MGTKYQHLSNADVAWLRMDLPTNLMVINSVWLFDERLDWERLAGIVEERLVRNYPRFRQRVVESRGAFNGPHWEDDPDFEISRHMHRRGLSSPGDDAALKELVGDLASVPLNHGKPLWEMYLVDGPGDGCAVVSRIHHCIADGISLAQVMLTLTDASPEPDTSQRAPAYSDLNRRSYAPPLLSEVLLSAAGSALSPVTSPAAEMLSVTKRITETMVREALKTFTHPEHAREIANNLINEFTDYAPVIAKLLLTPSDTPSVFKPKASEHGRGAARGVAWTRPFSLEKVKKTAHAQNATVNDVLLAAVSGVLRDYLISRGEEPHEIRTLVPVNLRAVEQPVPRDLGNHFGLVFLTLPVDQARRRDRLEELKKRMTEIKNSPEGPLSYAVLEAIGLTPPEVESRVIDIFTAKATAVMTNVPGPRKTVYLAGSPLRAVLVWAPTSGSVGMSVSILSYNDQITIGLLVHVQDIPDPGAITDRIQRELTAIAKLSPANN